MGKACSQNEQGWSAYKIVTCKPTVNRLLGRPRCRWQDNIGTDIKETGVITRNWIRFRIAIIGGLL
jgi:hypothetical protein